MVTALNGRQLTGLDGSHLVEAGDGQRLLPEAARAFAALQEDARNAGFELAIASAWRSFERQRLIWNGKAAGERPVYADDGRQVVVGELSPRQRLRAILRFSAIPGTSRHHWGTDLDVYDAAAVPADYRVQLSPDEVSAAGVFGPLHTWLDRRMKAAESHGFYRPYAVDRGGVAVERWHLSYAPQALECEAGLSAGVLRHCWEAAGSAGSLLLREQIEEDLQALLARYVQVDPGWCPPAGGFGV